MKRVCAYLMAMVMLLAITACGGQLVTQLEEKFAEPTESTITKPEEAAAPIEPSATQPEGESATPTEASKAEEVVQDNKMEESETAMTEQPQTESVEEIIVEQSNTVIMPTFYYTKVGDIFTNGIQEIRYENDKVLCREIASNTERTLFEPEKPEGTTLELIAVTDGRVYFGWNEIDDWWGVDVYSVDYQGMNRKDYGYGLETSFQDGFLLLKSFRTDVSPSVLCAVNYQDETILDIQQRAVWPGAFLDGDYYYVYIANMPESYEEQSNLTDYIYELTRLDVYGNRTVIKTYHFDSPYHFITISEDGTVRIWY